TFINWYIFNKYSSFAHLTILKFFCATLMKEIIKFKPVDKSGRVEPRPDPALRNEATSRIALLLSARKLHRDSFIFVDSLHNKYNSWYITHSH
ncbi:hypothetical protein JUJ52_17450, partial [Virgibacillus sp. AGTR]|uniref:hypothetical protein n=1 Tax=Virgibacillus sp. AGTR TaxID=2812055 RepID=UPI001D16D18D